MLAQTQGAKKKQQKHRGWVLPSEPQHPLEQAGLCSPSCCPQQRCSCRPAQLFGDPLGQGNQGEPAPNPATSAQSSSPDSSNKEWKNTERISAELPVKGAQATLWTPIFHLWSFVLTAAAYPHTGSGSKLQTLGRGEEKKKKETKRREGTSKRERERVSDYSPKGCHNR